nr:hypothetical protein [Tanacetum cinerariifolium]
MSPGKKLDLLTHLISQNPLVAESTSGRAESAAESTADRRCEQILPGPKAVTVEVRIAPLHTMYPAISWVALLTE